MNVCKRDPRSGKVTTGGIVTVKDSTCLLYTSKKAAAAAPTAQQTLDALAQLGVQVECEDEQKGKNIL